jgi:hypothetical protein
MGLMQALELVEDRQTKAPAARATAELMEAARENGLLLGKGGMYGNVHPHFAAHEHRPLRRGPVPRDAGQGAGYGRRGDGRRAQMSEAALAAPDNRERFPELHPALDGKAALAEANRCLFCYRRPVHGGLPHPHRRAALHQENLDRQPARLGADDFDSNVLGLSCARVCPVDVLCEGACVMVRENYKPIEIGRLQRFAMDRFYEKPGALDDPVPNYHTGERWAAWAAAPRRSPARRNCAAGVTPSPILTTARSPADSIPTAWPNTNCRPQDSLREVEMIRSLGVEFRQAWWARPEAGRS